MINDSRFLKYGFNYFITPYFLELNIIYLWILSILGFSPVGLNATGTSIEMIAFLQEKLFERQG